jgi:hypothetical protein
MAIACCLLPIAAAAQTDGAAAVTEVDKKSSGLAGGYAGVVFDEHFFVGGGGYVLASRTRGRDLAYGGLMLQWLGGGNDVFGFSVKTLLGGGSTESSGTVQVFDRGRVINQSFRARQNFLVAEPELDALVRITDHLRLAVGAGYRFTGSDWGRRDSVFDLPGSRLNGPVASISLQIGGGS